MMFKTLLITFFISIFSLPITLASGLDLENDYRGNENNLSINSNQNIDISGDFRPPKRKKSAADRLKIMREKLEKQNEILVKKQIERIRLQSELEMTKRLKRMFDQKMEVLNQI